MIELLVGPIASGKSTYCKAAAAEGAIIVNDDAIVTAMHGGNYRLYKKGLKPLYKIVENTIVSTALAMGQRVVIDRPNITFRMRQRYIGMAHSFDSLVRIVMFKRELPEVHAQRRTSDNRGYDYDYWLNVAQIHDSQYEPPDQAIERFDEIVNWDFPDSFTATENGL